MENNKEKAGAALGILRNYKAYKEGEEIHSLDEFVEQEFVFIRGKLYHRGFTQSFQIRFLKTAMDAGAVKRAVKIEGANGV